MEYKLQSSNLRCDSWHLDCLRIVDSKTLGNTVLFVFVNEQNNLYSRWVDVVILLSVSTHYHLT